MAENKEIVIRIINEDNTKNKGNSSVDVTGESQKKSSDAVFDTTAMVFAIRKVAEDVKQIGINEIKYQMNLYFEMNDNYLGQQNLNRALNVVDKAKEYGKSMISYGMLGAMVGGPIGAAIGAFVGAGIETFKTQRQIEHNRQQENINIARMDAQLQFNRQRAGYSLTAGSIGENR